MIYYVEVNIIAITIGAILLFLGHKISSKNETSQLIMNYMLVLLIIVSVSDIFAYYFREKSYFGVQLANVLYFLAFNLGAYAWFVYIVMKMEYSVSLRKVLRCTGAPAFILAAAIALNPLTNYFFSVDKQLIYHRGPGIILTWVIEWGYILIALALNIHSVLTEKRLYRKQEYQGYLIFTLPMVVSALCQMFFYGTTTTQIGFAIALLMAFLNKQFYMVQRDALTGLNNRNALLNYQDSLLSKFTEHEVTLFMLDMDDFKTINDNYGHVMGDCALKDIADILKASVYNVSPNRVTLFRYGGDEFVIVGNNMTSDYIQTIQDSIEKNIQITNERNHADGKKYSLSVSIGVASQTCKDIADFDLLIRHADKDMYRAKSAKKVAHH